MGARPEFRYTNRVWIIPFFSVLLIWTVFWFEVTFDVNLNTLGVYPRSLSGLKGILFSPLVHGSIEHLYNNSLPLAILLGALLYFYRKNSLKVLLIGALLSGIFTWVVGRPSYHIGASGIIYLLASFIFFKGIFTRHYRHVALSLAVVFIYGSLLWYIFPIMDEISWEGHLGGFISGLFLALAMPSEVAVTPKYVWEKEDYREEDDPFMRHFDKDGNFIEDIRDPSDNETKYKYYWKKEDPASDSGNHPLP